MIRLTVADMPPLPVRPLVDRILDGKLNDLLLSWKAEGLSPNAMSRRLLVEHDLDVGEDTIRKWVNDAETAEAVG